MIGGVNSGNATGHGMVTVRGVGVGRFVGPAGLELFHELNDGRFAILGREVGGIIGAIERLAARGMTAEEAARRLAAQGDVGAWVDRFHEASRRNGRPRAIAILDNGGTLAQLHAQVDALARPPGDP